MFETVNTECSSETRKDDFGPGVGIRAARPDFLESGRDTPIATELDWAKKTEHDRERASTVQPDIAENYFFNLLNFKT